MKRLRLAPTAAHLRAAIVKHFGRPVPASELGLQPANLRGVCGMPLRGALCRRPGGHHGDCTP